jgi:NADH-ubiquinone oxidoreductase chain 5
MITTCGASNYAVGIFHLFNHAFFKALLFLSAGAVIHALANEQDIRKYGGLTQVLIFSYTLVLIGSLALIGTPFLTGFYSKDFIIELACARYALSVHFSYLLATFSVLTTSYYSFRLIFFCFSNSSNITLYKSKLFQSERFGRADPRALSNAHGSPLKGAHDPDWVMSLPLIILALGAIFVGFLFKDMFIGLGTDFWNNAIFVNPQNANLIEAEFLPIEWKLIPLFLTIAGAFLAYVLNLALVRRSYLIASSSLKQVYMFLNRRWLYDKLLNDLVAYPSYYSSFHLLSLFDKGLFELLPVGTLGLSNNLKRLYMQLGDTQSGLIFHYAILMILSAVCFFAVLTSPAIFLVTDSRLIAIMFVSIMCLI